MCGEKKSFANSIEMELGSPPHVRGKVVDTPESMNKLEDHPRMCGEKIFVELGLVLILGSPPHVRGKD